jgi:hypothetical protein
MPALIKPSFPNPDVATLHKRLDSLGAALQRAQAADGSVDVKSLEAAVDATQDPALKAELAAVRDAFQRRGERQVPGCGGGTTRQTVFVLPTKLEGAEVTGVLAALLEAKTRLQAFDSDGSGQVERGEKEAVDRIRWSAPVTDLPHRLARAALYGELVPYAEQMKQWNVEVNKVYALVGPRQGLEMNIQGQVQRHVQSPAGREAVAWAFRLLVIENWAQHEKDPSARKLTATDVWRDMDRGLAAAESSMLRFLGIFGLDPVENGPHLDDREVKRFLKDELHCAVSDLASFSRTARASVEAKLGMTYQEWHDGKDVPGHEQLKDKDFLASPRVGC